MGVDITMSIVKDKKIIKKDIFDGRNTEWFNNLQGRGIKEEYEYLPKSDYEKQAPDTMKLEKLYDLDYYGFGCINVGDYKKWFYEYKPNYDAGWVTTYEKWKWDCKHIEPTEVYKELPKDINPADWHFIEFKIPYDCSSWLVRYLLENNIEDDAYIIYYFDC